MIDIACSFFRASQPNTAINLHPHIYKVTKSEIGIYGDLYTGNLIRSLGIHYDDYVNANGAPVWRINNRSLSPAVGRIKLQSEKHKSQAVTGNIGEAVVMPALESAMGSGDLLFHRMKAHQIKCPDFRFCCNWPSIDALWGTSLSSLGTLPSDMPLEVKTHLNKDQGYLLEALEQLVKYWIECDRAGLLNAVGYGIIARIDLDVTRNPGSNRHFIRYFLFARKANFTLKKLERVMKIIKSKEFKQREKTTRQKLQNRWIGRYML